MTRWDDLVMLLKAGDVTERQVATAVIQMLTKGGGSKEHRAQSLETAAHLEGTIARWRAEDRAAEE